MINEQTTGVVDEDRGQSHALLTYEAVLPTPRDAKMTQAVDARHWPSPIQLGDLTAMYLGAHSVMETLK